MLTAAGVFLCLPALWLFVTVLGVVGQAAAQQGLRGPVFVALAIAIVAAFFGGNLLLQAGWFR